MLARLLMVTILQYRQISICGIPETIMSCVNYISIFKKVKKIDPIPTSLQEQLLDSKKRKFYLKN